MREKSTGFFSVSDAWHSRVEYVAVEAFWTTTYRGKGSAWRLETGKGPVQNDPAVNRILKGLKRMRTRSVSRLPES